MKTNHLQPCTSTYILTYTSTPNLSRSQALTTTMNRHPIGALLLACLFLTLHETIRSGAHAATTSGSFSIFNLRFAPPYIAGPAAVVFPGSKEELRGAVLCARHSMLAIRVRSGEGQSYTTENRVPLVVVDLANLSRVRVDPGSATGWADPGATVGELYCSVGQSSPLGRSRLRPDTDLEARHDRDRP